MPVSTSLLAELRRRIRDTRFAYRALSLSISDTNTTTAIVEITDGHLITTIAGGSAPSLNLDLSNSRYDTLGKLYQVLSRAPGYVAQRDKEDSNEHASIDLEPFGPLDISSTGVDLAHHLFADSELEEILKTAIMRHNPSLTVSTLPPQEFAFVLHLAEAGVCRIQAMDVAKRRGTEKDVSALLQVASTFEDLYKTDTTRLMRTIQSPREANSNTMDEGDVVIGSLVRPSGRTGYMSPLSQTIPPDAAVLLDPDEHDVEDDNVRVVWQRNKNFSFYSYELWMDNRPDVVRSQEGTLVPPGVPFAITNQDTLRDGAHRATTSKMVFRAYGPNTASTRSTYAMFVEEFGQLIGNFAVSQLESQTDYYFRLYVVGGNYVAVASNVVKATTKALRAMFLRTYPVPNPQGPSGTALSLTSGPPGTVVTCSLNNMKGAFTAQHVVRLGDKVVTATIINPYQFTFVVPAYQNIQLPMDVSIVSPNQLIDRLKQVFTVSTS